MKINEKVAAAIICLIMVGGIILAEIVSFILQPKIDAWRIKKIQENLNQNIVVTIQR